MRRSWIFAATTVAVIALAGWWALPEVGGDGCLGGEPCAAGPSTPASSGGPAWFYGGEGVHRTREGGNRQDTREVPADGNATRCDGGRLTSPTVAGGRKSPRGCEDVRARFY